MTRQQLINNVKAIIIEEAKPARIWLYGSEASGESKESSDIDIAYWLDKDKPCIEIQAKINKRIETLETLVHIDCENLAFSTERFINRIKSTGKVLYSATKELRAEDALFNYGKALKRLEQSLKFAEKYKNDEEMADVVIDVQVKRFEFTFEMCWKAIKRVLAYKGLEAMNPRDCFKLAYQQQWLSDQDDTLDMIEMRNTTAHTYDLSSANEIGYKLTGYNKTFQEIYQNLEDALSK